MESKKESFNCRKCGHNGYKEVRKSNNIYVPGGRSWVERCYCEGCGVIFIEATLFSVPKSQSKEK